MNTNKDILLVSEDESFKDRLREKLHIETQVRTITDVGSISSYRDICCILCDTTVEWRDFLGRIRCGSNFLPFILFIDKNQKENIDIDRLSSIGLTDYYFKDEDYGLLENRIIEAVNFYLDGDEIDVGFVEDIIDGLKDVVYLFDSNGDFLFWNKTIKEVTGYTDTEISSLSPTDFFRGEDKQKIRKSISRILTRGESERIEAELVTKDGRTIPYEFRSRTLKNKDGEIIGICGVGRDISERKHRVNQLSALNKAIRDFMDSENLKEIAQNAVDIAPDVLDLPIVCIYTIDKNDGRLDPIAYTPKTKEVVGDPPSFSGGEETTWKTYIDGNTRIYGQKDIEERKGFFLDTEKNSLESTIYVPIGDHGVFVGSSTSKIEYDTVDIEFIETYVSTIDSAFNSAKREQKLRKREKQLQKRTDRLENLDRLNQVLRTIAQAVVQTSTQKEIEKTVCNHLVDIEPYSFAWIGRYNTIKNKVEPKVTAGKHQNYLDNINISLKENEDKKTLSVDLEEVDTNQNILKNRSSGSWQEQALKRGYRSQITIPIKHKESIYGLLQIYSNKIGEFNQEKIKVLSQLGELIGHKINSIKRKEALLSGKTEKINIKTQDIDDFFSKTLQKETEIQILSMVPKQNNNYVLFSNIQNINKTKIKDIAKKSKDIQKIKFIDNKNNGHITELEVSSNVSPAVLADHGSIPRKYTKKQNGVLIHIEIPHTTNTRKLIEKIQNTHPNTEIISKTIETKNKNPAKTKQKIEDNLTDRQLEIIQAAYFGGIYETPRQTTGKQLAKKLDITPPTLHQHLKQAQKKILKTILEE